MSFRGGADIALPVFIRQRTRAAKGDIPALISQKEIRVVLFFAEQLALADPKTLWPVGCPDTRCRSW